MKILSAEQIREWDLFTVKNRNISSVQLMETAATKCVEWIVAHFDFTYECCIFCGSGNNGSDGFAMARMLYQRGFTVKVFIDQKIKKRSDDAQLNFEKISAMSGIEILDFSHAKTLKFSGKTIIIDAIFGTGLNRKIEGKARDVIEFINAISCSKISVDIPSGLFADTFNEENSVVFKADVALTFQCWKKSFLHPETGVNCGKIHVLDIGLDEGFLKEITSNEFTVDEPFINKIYKPRPDFSHKGNFGKTVIAGGSFGKIGAAVLATKAALKTGSGITFTLAPNCGYDILQISCPEAMFLSGGENFISKFEIPEDATCGIGPGLGTDPKTEKAFLDFLKNSKTPLVLDADALNIIAKNEKNQQLIPQNSIITPHPKEFERLFGKTENSFDLLELAREKAAELKIFIVLKDHHTQIITPEKTVFYNLTGNSGMAKGGSGDVLTGIITSLLSQHYSPEEAAVFGVWLHGKAGDFAAEKYSKEAMLPSNLIDEIGNVFKILERN